MRSSLQKQRLSVQKQASAVSPKVGWPAPLLSIAAVNNGLDCDAMAKPELDQLVQAASEKNGLQAELIHAVIGKESSAHPCALSPKGAQGLMQLMPATAMEMGIADPFDPKQNIDGGARLLKQLLTRYNGDVALALGAYHAGSGRVDREGGIPQIPETVNYVSDILSHFRIQ